MKVPYLRINENFYFLYCHVYLILNGSPYGECLFSKTLLVWDVCVIETCAIGQSCYGKLFSLDVSKLLR